MGQQSSLIDATPRLSKHGEGLATLWAKAKDGKLRVQRRDTIHTQSAHHSKTCKIDDGKILVTPGEANIPSCLQIRQTNRLNQSDPAS